MISKRYFWLIFNQAGGRFVHRFRSEQERLEFSLKTPSLTVTALHPEVRRIHRRMLAGEKLTFPVEVE